MQSIFRLPWCGDQIAPKMSEKPSLDQMRSQSAVEIPGLSQFKRKRTSSPEPQTAPQSLAKKPRPAGGIPQRLPLDIPQLPSNCEQTNPASLAYATPGATPTTVAHRSDYLSPVTANTGSDIKQTDIVNSGASRKDSAVGPPRTGSTQQQPAAHDVPMDDAHTAVKPESALQQAIENQFNMQILLKHNELRLIDQELAKCQVALEQLRRCELRPFPGSQRPTESVSAGTGPAINPQPGHTKPSHAAPYGVTDGPYSRHYRAFLLADSQFDSEAIRTPGFAESAMHAANRPTRNNGSARKTTGKSIGSIPGEFMSSIPNYPAAPTRKEKSGPLVLRRSSDGKLVKLVCNDCNRGDMNSIQGFLNHCRIAHKVDYKSHDQAALDCGRLLEDHEIASLPDAAAIPIAKGGAPRPAQPRPSVSAAVPVHVPTSTAVHPLNIPGAALPDSSRSKPTKKRAVTAARPLASPASGNTASTFKPSFDTPRLSALFAKNSVGGDLNQAVANAKQKIDLSAEEDISSPDLSSPSSPAAAADGAHALGSTNINAAAPRPSSRKGHRHPQQQRPRPSPLAPQAQQFQPPVQATTPTQLPDSPLDMSPHAADSNPGMISDLEDDDHGSASEEETAMPPPSRGSMLPVNPVSRSCGDNNAMDLDVSVDDEMDEHGVIIRRNSMLGLDGERERKMASTAGTSKLG